jgi:hypothetical protein
LLGLGLGLTSWLCWGVSDFIGGFSARRLPPLFVMIPARPSATAVSVPVVVGIALALLAAAGFGCYFVGVQSSARADPMWALLGSS